VKFHRYFYTIERRAKHPEVTEEMVAFVLEKPTALEMGRNGRTSFFRRIPTFGNRVLRVIVLQDGEAVLNAFFDRRADI